MQICGCLRDFMTLRVARFVFKIAHLTISMEPRGFRACGLLSRLWPRKSTDDNLYLKNICDHRRPRLCGSSLDFEFIRKCMKIYKKSPKFHFLTTLRDFLSVILVPFFAMKVKILYSGKPYLVTFILLPLFYIEYWKNQAFWKIISTELLHLECLMLT